MKSRGMMVASWLRLVRSLRWICGKSAQGQLVRKARRAVGAKCISSRAPGGSTRPAAVASGLEPMAPERVRDARLSLRRILDCHPSAARIWPSIVLVDRAMGQSAGEGIDRLSPQVLHDAVVVLHRLLDEFCEFGIIVLLERMDRILRVVHGAPSSAMARWNAVRPAEIQVLEATITEFMEIDREWDEHLLVEQEAASRNQAS
jgi:hypothetical protein